MAFLLSGLGGLASSLFSSPLVRGVIGDLAGGVVSSVKKAAGGLLNGAVNSLNSTAMNVQSSIDDYEPPIINRYNKRPAPEYIDDEIEESIQRPRQRRISANRKQVSRKRSTRVPYNPDLITEYEE